MVGTNLYLFFPVALFILLFNLIGKVLVILRIQNNFKLVSSEKLKHDAVFLKDRNLLREISRGLSMEEYTCLLYTSQPGREPGFPSYFSRFLLYFR